jgi:hypothetical protein
VLRAAAESHWPPAQLHSALQDALAALGVFDVRDLAAALCGAAVSEADATKLVLPAFEQGLAGVGAGSASSLAADTARSFVRAVRLCFEPAEQPDARQPAAVVAQLLSRIPGAGVVLVMITPRCLCCQTTTFRAAGWTPCRLCQPSLQTARLQTARLQTARLQTARPPRSLQHEW